MLSAADEEPVFLRLVSTYANAIFFLSLVTYFWIATPLIMFILE